MTHIFKVRIIYMDGTISLVHVKARDDVVARDEAIKCAPQAEREWYVDSGETPVSYCEIAHVCVIDNEE